jgi:pimeloyl-ACP methyl ester carboxylesterase
MNESHSSGSPETPNTSNNPSNQNTEASPLQERGVIIEGQRIATAMNDAPRALLSRAPLVLLPDAGFTWREYCVILERLAPERRVFALDWPGFGASARPSPAEYAYTLDHLAGVLRQWLDALGVARAVLLAGGLAAGVAVRFAAASSQRVAGLALVGPLGFAPRGALETLAGYTLRAPALSRLAEPALTSLALGPTTEATRAIEEERRAERARPEHAVTLAASAALWRDMDVNRAETPALARAVRAPSAVIRGGLDPLCSAAEARAAAEALGERGGLEVTLPEAGHLPHLQQPERFFQALAGLIATAEVNLAAAN